MVTSTTTSTTTATAVAPAPHDLHEAGRRSDRLARGILVRSLTTGLLLAAFDFLGMLVVAAAATLLLNLSPDVSDAIPIATVLLVVYVFSGLYPGVGVHPVVELRQVTVATSLAFSVLLLLEFFTNGRVPGTPLALIVCWVIALAVAPTVRFTARWLLGSRSWWGERAVVIGAGPVGTAIQEDLRRNPGCALRCVGILEEQHEYWQTAEDARVDDDYLGPIDEIESIACERGVAWALVAMPDRSREEIDRAVALCASAVPNVVVVPSIPGVPSLWTAAKECGQVSGLHTTDRLLLQVPRFVKRTLDLVLVVLGGLLVAPFLGILALLIKWGSPGPIFFGHERIGKYGRRFRAWKFRTMVQNADQVLEQHLAADPSLREEWERDHKLKNDPRVIPGVGKFLRKTSLDELPQIWNVLRGQMSLVGPRPIVQAEIEKYGHVYPLYLKVVPGITGLWQVSGRNLTTYEERISLDAYYVKNWSPWLDLFILARTFKTVLLREGAF